MSKRRQRKLRLGQVGWVTKVFCTNVFGVPDGLHPIILDFDPCPKVPAKLSNAVDRAYQAQEIQERYGKLLDQVQDNVDAIGKSGLQILT